MDASEILTLRLHNTGLCNPRFNNAADAVSSLGAVQAQDFTAAKWALGLRVINSTDQNIERAYNEGAILRTHVMRPTLHFIVPEDIRWMLELTAPRIKLFLATYTRKLGLGEGVFEQSNAAIENALHDRVYITRQELREVLKDAGIETDTLQLGHLIIRAELDGIICSGPRRGTQFTYALLEERVEKSHVLSREQALGRLALKYFTCHGPAQLKDFSWWSGLTTKDARAALDLIKLELDTETIHGTTYWLLPHREVETPNSPSAFLLSVYDEYTIAYKDRGDISDAPDIEKMIAMGNSLNAVIVLNGRVAGTWNKTRKKNSVEIRLNPFRELNKDEDVALESEVARYGKFFGIPAVFVSNYKK